VCILDSLFKKWNKNLSNSAKILFKPLQIQIFNKNIVISSRKIKLFASTKNFINRSN